MAEVATRIAGSNDLYEHSGRRPYASINFITAHDGFTLHDLVSYNHKHNEANGEHNRDGENHNLSWNCGVEGPTTERCIIRLREQQKRNLMASLLLSVGVPMISGGDEMGRTQHGNNNAYCQDSELSWTPWDLSLEQQQFLAFTRRLVRFRRAQPVLTRRKYFQGRAIRGAEVKDIYWLDPSGREMTDEAWNAPFVRSLGVLMVGNALDEVDERGRQVRGDTLLILLNAHHDEVPFALPTITDGTVWVRMIDTIEPYVEERRYTGGQKYRFRAGRSRYSSCAASSAGVSRIPLNGARTARRRRYDDYMAFCGDRGSGIRDPAGSGSKPIPDPRSPIPDESVTRRVVVERVQPEIDAGRFPIKRTIGESVMVSADVFADGHDLLAGVVKYRGPRPSSRDASQVRRSPGSVSTRREDDDWREVPLEPLGNDGWGASFTVTDLGTTSTPSRRGSIASARG